MKLCYIADANSIYTQRWMAPLIERGDIVHFLSFTPVEHPITGIELVDLTRITNVRKLRFAYWGWWIGRYVRHIRPDVLHAHSLVGGGWLGVMANYHPFVVSGWGSDLLIEPQKSALRRFLLSVVLRRCDRLTVPSQLMCDAARALGVPDMRLRLIPGGIETDVFQPTPNDCASTRKQFGIEPDAKVVLSARGVAAIYNLDIVLEAINAIKTQVTKLQLVLIRFHADPDYLAKLECTVAAYGLGEIVHWLPPQQTASEMARLYRMSDVVISIPSSEGYGFTVYEAMATGCPTLISDLPVFKDELVDGIHTIKVPVRDATRTSQALIDVLTDQDLGRKLRRNALKVCQGKSVRKRIEQTDALYRDLVKIPCGV